MTHFSQIYKYATAFVLCGSAMFFIVIGQGLFWALDRAPPFKALGYTSQPTPQGQTTTIKVKVKRDLGRMCSVTYSRLFLDSKGVAWDLTEGVRLMTAKSLDELDKRNPDMLTIKVTVPEGAALGKGSVMTVLEYACTPVHQLYPIQMVVVNDVEVLPKNE